MLPALRPLLIGGVCALSVACLGQPLPRRVVAGTTMLVPIATEAVGGGLPLAFGADASLNPGTLLASDPQRGNVRFVLCSGTAPAACGTELPLVVRYLTRVLPDRGSRLGRTAKVAVDQNGTRMTQSESLVGQPLVILDVPLATPAGQYQLTYALLRPGETEEERGTLGPVEVLAGSGEAFSDLSLALQAPGVDVTPALQGLVPDPQLELVLIDRATASDRPAAGSLVLRYPESVTIEGAFEAGVLGQGSLVRVNPGPSENTVSILFLDPDRNLSALRVAFRLLPGAEPVTADGFSIEPGSEALYRSEGIALPITQDPAASGNSFRIEPAIL